jgi:hypothetical protein
MNTSPNRMVAIATPLVFAPLAGALTALAAKYAPGLEIDEGQLQAIFIAGATIALAKSGLWLKGWQDYEKREQAGRAAAVAEVADDPYSAGDEVVYDDEAYDDEVADEWDPALDDDDEAEDAQVEDDERDAIVAGV